MECEIAGCFCRIIFGMLLGSVISIPIIILINHFRRY